MKKIILFLTLSISLFAYTSVNNLTFESGISIYGKVGFVDVTLEENHDAQTYKMQAIASSTGVVKALSNNRKDIFISEGNIKNGIYLPTKFTRKTLKTDYEKLTTYIFDYEKNKVIKTRVVFEDEITTHLDIINMKFTNTKKRVIILNYTREIKLDNNDFLSLYLNMQNGNIKKGKVSYIDKKAKDSLFLITNNQVEVHKNSGKDKYNIELYYDKNSIFFEKIVSVGIAFYGDAYIKKISENTKILN